VRIAAVLLAAGRGRRAGGPKALLRYGGATFLEHAVRLFSRPGVDRVVVVLGHDAGRIRETVRLPEDVVVTLNEDPDAGMLGSVLRGLYAADAFADAVLLHPVDHPLVEAETIDRVAEALRGGAVVAVPSFGGRRGHPGGFARPAWGALRGASPAVGAREVLAAHPEWIVHVTGGPGCVAGVDTPADYRRLISSGV
jgi:CTP:molybdopterin cytidylyltransferase MocA